MPIVALGSTSQLKLTAVSTVSVTLFPAEVWEVKSVPCDSQVPETPWDSETLSGAETRARAARRASPAAVFAVGLESGLVERFGELYEEAWACVLGCDDVVARGYSSGLRVPPVIVSAMSDKRMSHAQLLRDRDGDPRTGRDTWSVYTDNKLGRLTALTECVRNAMVLFVADGSLSLDVA